jgi:hypothetical protein
VVGSNLRETKTPNVYVSSLADFPMYMISSFPFLSSTPVGLVMARGGKPLSVRPVPRHLQSLGFLFSVAVVMKLLLFSASKCVKAECPKS